MRHPAAGLARLDAPAGPPATETLAAELFVAEMPAAETSGSGVSVGHPLVALVVGRRLRALRYGFVGAVLAFVVFEGPAERLAAGETLGAGVVWINGGLFALLFGLVAVHARVLVPRLLVRGRMWAYAASALGLVAAFAVAEALLVRAAVAGVVPAEPPTLVGFTSAALLPLVFLGATAGVQLFGQWAADAGRLQETRARQLRAELDAVRGRLQPHFLFNTLNNLEALVRTDPDRALRVLADLSDVLRYGLYDAQGERVPLLRDLDYVRKLLALEQIRRDDFTVAVRVSGALGGLSVAPFLFMPYVENAVKHSATAEGPSSVTIDVAASRRSLTVSVANSVPAVPPVYDVGGLGLANGRRRLELLYPGRHTVAVEQPPGAYVVRITLDLADPLRPDPPR